MTRTEHFEIAPFMSVNKSAIPDKKGKVKPTTSLTHSSTSGPIRVCDVKASDNGAVRFVVVSATVWLDGAGELRAFGVAEKV